MFNGGVHTTLNKTITVNILKKADKSTHTYFKPKKNFTGTHTE